MPTQQAALYAAEDEIFEGVYFTSLEHVQEWIDGLRDIWWWEARVPQVLKIDVHPANVGERDQAWYDESTRTGIIEFATPIPSMRSVVHELAHVLAQARHGSQSHDPWYARILLELTYLLRGIPTYEALFAAFVRHGIDFDADGLA